MNVYIDFDRTIFDSDKFYKDIFNIIKKFDIDDDVIRNAEKTILEKNIVYNINKVIDYLIEKYNLPSTIKEDIVIITKKLDTYVFDDVYIFLKKMKKLKYKIIVLTYGDKEFQNFKIRESKIDSIVDEVIVTETYKFEKKLNYNNSIFIDDNMRDLIGLCKNGAKKIYRIKRKNTKYSILKNDNKNIKEFVSLVEIYNDIICG